MTQSPSLTQTQFGPAAAPKRIRTSIGQRITLLSLLPVIAVGSAWIINTYTVQRGEAVRSLQASALQLSSSYAERVVDLQDFLGLPLSDPEVLSGALISAESVIRKSPLPITNVTIINPEGLVALGYGAETPAGSAATQGPALTNRWKSQHVALVAAAKVLADDVFSDPQLTDTGKVSRVQIDGQTVTLAASRIESGDGVAVMSVDPAYITAQLARSVRVTVVVIIAIMLLTVFATIRVSGPLIRRIKTLSRAVTVASRRSTLEARQPIPIEGNDEITALAEGIELLDQSLQASMAMNEEDLAEYRI